MKTHYKIRKGIAAFTAFIFVCSNPPLCPAFIQEKTDVPSLAQIPLGNSSIGIPDQYIGSIDEVYIGSRVKGQESRNDKTDSKNDPNIPCPLPLGSCPSPKTIIFIQDAHDSLEAQENISHMISYLVDKGNLKTVFEEGFENSVPTDEYFGFIKDPVIREKVSYFFLDKLRIGGAEYAHINRSREFKLIGVDSIRLHLENIQMYQETAKNQKETEKILEKLHHHVQKLANRFFSKELKSWMKIWERYQKQSLDFPDYLERTAKIYLASSSEEEFRQKYPNLNLILEAMKGRGDYVKDQLKAVHPKVLFQEMNALENELPEKFLKKPEAKQVFEYLKQLTLLRRLNRIEIKQPEYEAVAKVLKNVNTEKLADFILEHTRKSFVLPKKWEKSIQNAIRFYEIAHQRNNSMEHYLDEFMEQEDEKEAVLVFGGFHQADIREILEKKGFSYVVITPKISSVSKRHQKYYRELMSKGHYDFESPFVARASRTQPILSLVGGRSEIHAAYEGVLAFPDASRPVLHRKLEGFLQAYRSENRTNSMDALRAFVLEDIRGAILDVKAAYGDTKIRGKTKDNQTVATIADYLAQMMTEIALDRFYPGETVMGEEKLTADELEFIKGEFDRLEKLGHPDLKNDYQKYLRAYEMMLKRTERKGIEPVVWRVVDAVDGTRDFQKGLIGYGYSLARLVWDEKLDQYVPESGMIFTPEYETVTLRGEKLKNAMLEFHRDKGIKIWHTTDWGETRAFQEKFERSPDQSSRVAMLRDSSTTGPNPYVGAFVESFPDEFEVTTDWESSVVGLMEAILGNIGIFGGNMRLWDHAAALGMIQALGGAAFRIDSPDYYGQDLTGAARGASHRRDAHEYGRELIGYSREDIERGKKAEPFPIIVAMGEENLQKVRTLLDQVRIFRYVGDDEAIATLSQEGKLSLWDAKMKKLIREMETGIPAENVMQLRQAMGRYLFIVEKPADERMSYDIFNAKMRKVSYGKITRIELETDRRIEFIYDYLPRGIERAIDTHFGEAPGKSEEDTSEERKEFQEYSPVPRAGHVGVSPQDTLDFEKMRIPAQVGEVFLIAVHPSDTFTLRPSDQQFFLVRVDPSADSGPSGENVLTVLNQVDADFRMVGFDKNRAVRFPYAVGDPFTPPQRLYFPKKLSMRTDDWDQPTASKAIPSKGQEAHIVVRLPDGSSEKMAVTYDAADGEMVFDHLKFHYAVIPLSVGRLNVTRQGLGYSFPEAQPLLRRGGVIKYPSVSGVRKWVIEDIQYSEKDPSQPVRVKLEGDYDWKHVGFFESSDWAGIYFPPKAVSKAVLRSESRIKAVPLGLSMSEEFLTMSEEFKRILEDPAEKMGPLPIFLRIREFTERELKRSFKRNTEEGKKEYEDYQNRLDESLVFLKESMVQRFLENWKGAQFARERARLKEEMIFQARFFFDRTDGFGTTNVQWNPQDIEEDLKKKIGAAEDPRENMFWASVQALDILQKMGDKDVVSELLALSKMSLEAHREAVGLHEMLVEVDQARKNNKQDDFRKFFVRSSRYYEAVRRWTDMNVQIMDVLTNIALEMKGDSELQDEYQAINEFFLDVLSHYAPTGEGYYWLRDKAARILGYFDNDQTVETLLRFRVSKDPIHHIPPDSVFMIMNSEAVNRDAVSLLLPAGEALIQIFRTRSFEGIRDNAAKYVQGRKFEEKDHRVARLMGIADALVSPDVSEKNRVLILKRIAEIKSDDFAFAANFLLDILEDMVVQDSSTIIRDYGDASILTGSVRNQAFDAFLRIAKVVGRKLEASKNEKLILEYTTDLGAVASTKFTDKAFGHAFKVLASKVHIVLGNLHLLPGLSTFEEGAENLVFRNNVVIESGGGAAKAQVGNVDRFTKEPTTTIISGTDNGGSTLYTRGMGAMNWGIPEAASGDKVTVDARAAAVQGVPGSKVMELFVQKRFGKKPQTFLAALKSIYGDFRKKANDEGSLDNFKVKFNDAKMYAEYVDKAGLTASWGAVKGLLYEGMLIDTKGHGEEFINPDGVYAGQIAFRDFMGGRGMGVVDHPFGNEMVITLRDGRRYVGQSWYSHTPKSTLFGRQRRVYMQVDVDNYYPVVPIHSRVADMVRDAKLILSGLTSWGTSLIILQKNKELVRAKVENKGGAKILITNAVSDDETIGMSWWDMAVTSLEAATGEDLELVWNAVLANSNVGLDKTLIMPAKPHLGTYLKAFNGDYGNYTGPITPTEEDIRKLRGRGMKVDASRQMMEIILSPQRQNPDLYIAMVSAVPEFIAAGVWDLMDEKVRAALEPHPVFGLIKRHEELDALLHGVGLSWESFGMESVHELKYRVEHAHEMEEWINNGKIPGWVKGKRRNWTWFQFTVAEGIRLATGRQIDPADVDLDTPIVIGRMPGTKELVYLQYASKRRTNDLFIRSRVRVQDDEEKLKEEEMNRMGKVERVKDGKRDGIHIILPNEIIDGGWSPYRRTQNMLTAVRFMVQRAARLSRNDFKDPWKVHQEHLAAIGKLAGGSEKDETYLRRLGVLSASVPLLRFLRWAVDNGYDPALFYDMDGTVTAPGTPKSDEMAYRGWTFERNTQVTDFVISGQEYRGPHKQIVEPVIAVERALEFLGYLTGVPRGSHVLGQKTGLDAVFRTVFIGAASGNADFAYKPGHGYYLEDLNPIPPDKGRLIEMAALATMPKSPYEVMGRVFDGREPWVVDGVTKGHAAYASYFTGREDVERSADPLPHAYLRREQGMLMDLIFLNPKSVVKQLTALIHDNAPRGEWILTLDNPEGDPVKIRVLERNIKRLKELIDEIEEDSEIEPFLIPSQRGGATTLDHSGTPKSDGVDRGIDVISKVRRQPRAKIRVGFVGDELDILKRVKPKDRAAFIAASARIREEDEVIEFSSVGNDYSVADEILKGERLKEVEFVMHTGPWGEDSQVLPNTVTSFDPRGVQPVWFNRAKSGAAAALRKGSAVNILHRYRGESEKKLADLGLSYSSFGAETFEDVNERIAQEILAMVIRSESRTIREEGQPVSEEVREIAAAVGEELGWHELLAETEAIESRREQPQREIPVERILNRLQSGAVVLVDYHTLLEKFSREQLAEFFALPFQYGGGDLTQHHEQKLKLYIYNADPTDLRLKPFRQRELRKAVYVVDGPAQEAYDQIEGLGRKAGETPVVHISKGEEDFRALFDESARNDIYPFRYSASEKRSGLLTTVLLFASLLESDVNAERLKEGLQWLGIERDSRGFFTVTSEFLESVNQQYLSEMVIRIAA